MKSVVGVVSVVSVVGGEVMADTEEETDGGTVVSVSAGVETGGAIVVGVA